MKINFKKNMVFILLSFFILETTFPAETKEIMLDEQTKEISTKQKTISEKSIYIKEVVENFLVTHKKKLGIALLAILCGLGFNHYVLKPFKKDIYDPIKENIARGDKLAKEAELLMQDIKTLRSKPETDIKTLSSDTETLELIKNTVEAIKQLNAITKNLKRTPAELRAEGKTMEADAVQILNNVPILLNELNIRLDKAADPKVKKISTLFDGFETLADTINKTNLIPKLDELIKKINELKTIQNVKNIVEESNEILPKVPELIEQYKGVDGPFTFMKAAITGPKSSKQDRSKNPKPSASNTTSTKDNPSKNTSNPKKGVFDSVLNKLKNIGKKASPENLAAITDEIHELEEVCAALENDLENDLEDGSEDEDGDSSTSGDKYNDKNPQPNREYTSATTTTEVTAEDNLKTHVDSNGIIPSSLYEGSDPSQANPDENGYLNKLNLSIIKPTSVSTNDSLDPIPLNDWVPDQLPQKSSLDIGNDTNNSMLQPIPTSSAPDAPKNSDSKQNQSFIVKTKSGFKEVGKKANKTTKKAADKTKEIVGNVSNYLGSVFNPK